MGRKIVCKYLRFNMKSYWINFLYFSAIFYMHFHDVKSLLVKKIKFFFDNFHKYNAVKQGRMLKIYNFHKIPLKNFFKSKLNFLNVTDW